MPPAFSSPMQPEPCRGFTQGDNQPQFAPRHSDAVRIGRLGKLHGFSMRRPTGFFLLAALLLHAGCARKPIDPMHPQPARSTFGEPGMAPGQLAYPRVLEAVTHEGQTQLFIIDKAARIQWFIDGEDRPRALWRTPSYDNGKPVGLAVHYDQQGPVLYIADTHEHRILIQRPPNALGEDAISTTSFGTYGYELGQLIYPCDVEILTNDQGEIERFYVAEYGGNDRVTVFDAQFTPLFSFGTFGNPWDCEPNEICLNRPQSLAIDRVGRLLYVADTINHRVGRFTLEGELLGWLGQGGPSDDPGRFEFPYSLQVLDDGTLLVCEYGNSRVQQLNPLTGERLALFGTPGRGHGQILNPWEVALTPGQILVLDSGNARVMSFDAPPPLSGMRDKTIPTANMPTESAPRVVGR